MHWFKIVLPLAYMCGNIYVLVRLWHGLSMHFNRMGMGCNFALPVWVRIIVMAIAAVAACSLFISIGIRHNEVPYWLMKLLHVTGSVWMLFTFYMIMLLLPLDIARAVIPALKSAAWFTSAKVFWGASALVAMVLIAGYINYINPKVVNLKLTLQHNLPLSDSSLQTGTELNHNPLKIAAISDVHLGYGTGRSLIRRYVKMINEQEPDIVLIVGDLIDNSTKPVKAKGLHKELDSIKAPLGIYMVPGNHEYISRIRDCKELIAETSIILLQDSIVTIPLQTDICSNANEAANAPVLKIIGRDDRMNSFRRKSLETLLAEAKEENLPANGNNSDTLTGTGNSGKGEIYTIVLDHQPYDLALTDSLGIDIQISGHTHRGQIWPFNLLTDKLYEQSQGYRKWSHSHIYVSSGLSLWGPPFRIGTNSELVVLEVGIQD